MLKQCLLKYHNSIVKIKNFNILIIDTNKNISETLQQYLELRGHNVSIIDDSGRSLYNISKNKYDIILLEQNLNKKRICGLLLSDYIKELNDNYIFIYNNKNQIENMNMININKINKSKNIIKIMNELETRTLKNIIR